MTKREMEIMENLLNQKEKALAKKDNRLDVLYDNLARAEEEDATETIALTERVIAKKEKGYEALNKEIRTIMQVLTALSVTITPYSVTDSENNLEYYQYSLE